MGICHLPYAAQRHLSLCGFWVSAGWESCAQGALSPSTSVICNGVYKWHWITLYNGWRQEPEGRGLRICPLCFSSPLVWHITDRRFLAQSEGLLFKTLYSCSLELGGVSSDWHFSGIFLFNSHTLWSDHTFPVQIIMHWTSLVPALSHTCIKLLLC